MLQNISWYCILFSDEKYLYRRTETVKKLVVEDNDIMQLAIQQEIRRSEDSRYDHRLHGVLLVGKGFSCAEVAELFNQNTTTVQRWVNSFNKKGFAGLYEGERPGRPRSLSEKKWKNIEKDLRNNPRDFGYEQSLWDGKLLSHHWYATMASNLECDNANEYLERWDSGEENRGQ